jgi:hypothetical protein
LRRWGLRCDTCTDEYKRERGCGEPPISPSTARKWDPEEWIGAQDGRCDPKAAGHRYRFADLSGVYSIGSWLWPCCPQWFATYADPATIIEAEAIIAAIPWYESQQLHCVMEIPLDAKTAHLVQRAVQFCRKFGDNERKRKAEIDKAEAARQAKRDARRRR